MDIPKSAMKSADKISAKNDYLDLLEVQHRHQGDWKDESNQGGDDHEVKGGPGILIPRHSAPS